MLSPDFDTFYFFNIIVNDDFPQIFVVQKLSYSKCKNEKIMNILVFQIKKTM